jgi:deoxyribodipyrimidine photo-lyase
MRELKATELERQSEHSLVWFRGKDLRISDHAPLLSGLKGKRTTCVFVLDPYFFEPARAQELPSRMQFLLDSLQALSQLFRGSGGELLVVGGPSAEVIPRLATLLEVTEVLAHRWTEPLGRARDRNVQARLSVPLRLFEGELLMPPGEISTKNGAPYQVFTPYSRAMRAALPLVEPLRAPGRLPPCPPLPQEIEALRRAIPTLRDLGIEKNPLIPQGGEAKARARLRGFVASLLNRYDSNRDEIAREGTSRLSCDLKFGTISPRTVWSTVFRAPASKGKEAFLNQLLWREFAYSSLWHRPDLLRRPFRHEFGGFPYSDNLEHWNAWCQGTTGIPIVDAAARQLLKEGFVHNRARMISASFLTKNLNLSYKKGEAHYLKYLADGDWALNNMGWQWSAGCGVDAAPYFRVFNPVLQGKRFDPNGDYVRRFVPELDQLPPKYIHRPWEAPVSILREANVRLEETYPTPIVDLKQSRSEYLKLVKSWLASKR